MKARRRQFKVAEPSRPAGTSLVPRDYRAFLADLKARIRAAQVRAALAVNRELIQLYWSIGQAIVHKQEQEGWGGKVIDRLARDIRSVFPGITGFSRTNIYRMRAFYLAYRPAASVVPQPVGQLTGQRRPAKPSSAARCC